MMNNIFGGYWVQFSHNIVISDDTELGLNYDLKPGFMHCVHQLGNNVLGGYWVQFSQNIVISDDIELGLNFDLKPGFMQCVHQLGRGKSMIKPTPPALTFSKVMISRFQPTPPHAYFLKSNEIKVLCSVHIS